MKISWKYLNQFIDLKNINILDITEKLTLAGFEAENIFYDRAILDTLFDVNITANRQDVTGFIHIAAELSVLLGQRLIIHEKDENIQAEIPLYILKNIYFTKKYTQTSRYLHYFKIQATETILDEINFINLKWGQAIKVYDLQLLKKTSTIEYHSYHHIIVNNKDEVYYNNNKLYEFKIHNGYHKTKIKNLVLINHNFFNIYSKQAYKDIFKTLNITNEQVSTTNISRYKNLTNKGYHTIICKTNRIKQILGPINSHPIILPISTKSIIKTLERLNFHVNYTDHKLNIKIPAERIFSINNEINIIEEIGRIYGFNNFIDQLPYFHHIRSKTSLLQLNKRIRRILRSNGLHEVINYSFQRRKDEKKYCIINPLNQELSILRNNLLENLIASKVHNIHQNNESFEVFEIGHIFIKDLSNTQYKESQHLSCLIGNESFNQSTWQNKNSALTWSQAKGQIEELLEKLNSQISWSTQKISNDFIDSLNDYIHPKRSIYINTCDQTIGILSQLNYRINSLIHSTNNFYFFEIDIIELAKTITTYNHLEYRYLPYANYPKITRDLSIKINRNILMEQILYFISVIYKNKKNTIESIKILNEYYNNNHNKTICFRIHYRSLNKTLTNEEIDTFNHNFKNRLLAMIESKT